MTFDRAERDILRILQAEGRISNVDPVLGLVR